MEGIAAPGVVWYCAVGRNRLDVLWVRCKILAIISPFDYWSLGYGV